jgi:hypothetical protein
MSGTASFIAFFFLSLRVGARAPGKTDVRKTTATLAEKPSPSHGATTVAEPHQRLGAAAGDARREPYLKALPNSSLV